MTQSDLYLLTVKSKSHFYQDGTPILPTIRNYLNRNTSGSCSCIHKFKVVGELMLLLVFEVQEVNQFENMVIQLNGGYNNSKCLTIECTALANYDRFAKRLGVESTLLRDELTNPLVGLKQVTWGHFTVDYAGKTAEELKTDWRKEATMALTYRAEGLKVAMYKVAAQPKIHFFTDQTVEQWDELSLELPLMQENAGAVSGFVKTVIDLDYCTV